MGTRIEIETELTFRVRLSALVHPFEDDVGISTPTIEDLAIEQIVGLELALNMVPLKTGGIVKVPIFQFNWADMALHDVVLTQVEDLIIEAYNESEGGDD